MKYTFEDLEKIDATVGEALAHGSDAAMGIFEVGGFLQTLSQSISAINYMLDQVNDERKMLYRILISLFLDQGLYDYTLERDALVELDKYKFDLEVDENYVKFEVRFPEQPLED